MTIFDDVEAQLRQRDELAMRAREKRIQEQKAAQDFHTLPRQVQLTERPDCFELESNEISRILTYLKDIPESIQTYYYSWRERLIDHPHAYPKEVYLPDYYAQVIYPDNTIHLMKMKRTKQGAWRELPFDCSDYDIEARSREEIQADIIYPEAPEQRYFTCSWGYWFHEERVDNNLMIVFKDGNVYGSLPHILLKCIKETPPEERIERIDQHFISMARLINQSWNNT